MTRVENYIYGTIAAAAFIVGASDALGTEPVVIDDKIKLPSYMQEYQDAVEQREKAKKRLRLEQKWNEKLRELLLRPEGGMWI